MVDAGRALPIADGRQSPLVVGSDVGDGFCYVTAGYPKTMSVLFVGRRRKSYA